MMRKREEMINNKINPEIKEVLEETLRVIENSATAIINITDYLNTVGSEHKGFKLLSNLFPALEWVMQVLEFTCNNFDDEEICTCCEMLTQQMNIILNSMENEDYVLLNDVLEENVLPIIQCINKVFKEDYLWENQLRN